MKFDSRYPRNLINRGHYRECEARGCSCSTPWRYDFKTEHDRIFFAACSSECLSQILESGLRYPTANLEFPIEPNLRAKKAIEDLKLPSF